MRWRCILIPQPWEYRVAGSKRVDTHGYLSHRVQTQTHPGLRPSTCKQRAAERMSGTVAAACRRRGACAWATRSASTQAPKRAGRSQRAHSLGPPPAPQPSAEHSHTAPSMCPHEGTAWRRAEECTAHATHLRVGAQVSLWSSIDFEPLPHTWAECGAGQVHGMACPAKHTCVRMRAPHGGGPKSAQRTPRTCGWGRQECGRRQ